MELKTIKNRIFSTALAMMLAVPAFASVAVAPTRIEINANKISLKRKRD